MKKSVHLASRKPEREVQEKLGIKAYHDIPLDQLAIRPQQSDMKLKWYRSIQSASDKKQSDEMLKDIGAIAELKPNGIITHSCFLFVHKDRKSVV